MARRFVKVSLATKLRLLYTAAVLGIIAAALIVPWYFMELLGEQGIQRSAAELTRLRVNEWTDQHHKNPAAAKDDRSTVAALFSQSNTPGPKALKGPYFIQLSADLEPDRPLDPVALDALRGFVSKPNQQLAVIRSEDQQGRVVYRCFRAVQSTSVCRSCHDDSRKPQLEFQPGQLVAMVDLTLPGSAAAGTIVWWTRGAFVVGIVLATLLAFVLFAFITQRVILRPVHNLQNLADKVTDGDLTVRSSISTGDELERLGASFNEMLDALADQHEKLRAANRALDLKLYELGEANVTLYQANKVKDEFLANISHELRTPLNSIMGFADLLSQSPDDRIQRYGQNIATSANNLLNIINDLLDLAKIEAGRAEVRLEKVSVTDTCQTLGALMRPLADKKELDFRIELDEDLPIIISDASKLQQILYNLLSNAIKFTPVTGRVTLSGGRADTQQSGPAAEGVYISVADTGPGIAETEQQQIFEKFHQLDKTLTKESSGTGLGLAITKELTNLLTGRLTLRSSPGQGTTFTVHLPLDATGAKETVSPGGADQ